MKDRLLDLIAVGLERPLVTTALVVGSMVIALLVRANERLERIIAQALTPPHADEQA